MRKMVLLLASVAVAMVVLSGVAWAATIQCPNAGTQCKGTYRADKMFGTVDRDLMYGAGGPDTMKGYEGSDEIQGGTGADKIFGGPGDDQSLSPSPVWYSQVKWDASDDYIYGGLGDDRISSAAGRTRAGVDRLYGESGNDTIYAAQRLLTTTRVAKDVINCGPGTNDAAYFDRGVDVVKASCEHAYGYRKRA